MQAEPSIAVVYATRGRAAVLAESLRLTCCQTLQPRLVLISCVDPSDAPELNGQIETRIIMSKPGLTLQRNAALEALPDSTDLVVFFDDDFLPHHEWLAAVANAFATCPDLVGVTGRLLADGIHDGGVSIEEGLRLLASPEPADGLLLPEPYSPYGCNMAFSMRHISGLRFDERLVLYGWQEDRDFGSRAARRGHVLRVQDAVGVHLGVRSARVPGRKLGYSQIVNPLYLVRKGTMGPAEAAGHIGRNLGRNLVRSLWPEPWIDRRGRLAGNVLGLLDVCRGRLIPERAQEF